MLVLTRRLGETIVIDGDIEGTVLAMSGKQVKLGIEAPPEIEIVREELLEAPQREAHKLSKL